MLNAWLCARYKFSYYYYITLFGWLFRLRCFPVDSWLMTLMDGDHKFKTVTHRILRSKVLTFLRNMNSFVRKKTARQTDDKLRTKATRKLKKSITGHHNALEYMMFKSEPHIPDIIWVSWDNCTYAVHCHRYDYVIKRWKHITQQNVKIYM